MRLERDANLVWCDPLDKTARLTDGQHQDGFIAAFQSSDADNFCTRFIDVGNRATGLTRG